MIPDCCSAPPKRTAEAWKMSCVKSLFVLFFLLGRASGMAPEMASCLEAECFAVFKESLNFKDAQNLCRQDGGELTTVRSQTLHVEVSSLLQNLNGNFWIALYRASDCPDPEKELKGFQWLSNNGEGNYTNWSPSFDSSCSSPRCVHISTKDSLQWVQAPCDEDATGFLCTYKNSHQQQESCTEIDPKLAGDLIVYSDPYVHTTEGEVPAGVTATLQVSEIKYLCFSSLWVQAPWNCEIKEGGCEFKCIINSEKSPTCYCPRGESVNPDNERTCGAQLADDPCRTLACDHICYQEGDSAVCACPTGYEIAENGVSCHDINECADPRQCPMDGTECVNVIGGFRCVCRQGFKMIGDACMDINECSSGACEHTCQNTIGSYVCSCFDGYRVSPNSRDECVLYCDEEECPATCDPNNDVQCFCPDGFMLDEWDGNRICVDINECENFFCTQDCINTHGSYECLCYPGYTRNKQGECKEDDEEDGSEGSGLVTPTPDATFPDPKRRPSGVSPGGLAGIIVGTTLLILLVLISFQLLLGRRNRREGSCA